jgi:hypothetical protein
MGNLHEVSLAEACERFRQRVATYLADKQEKVSRGELSELDHFPCWYCVQYLDKVPWLRHVPQHPWTQGEHHTGAGRSNGHVGSEGATPS